MASSFESGKAVTEIKEMMSEEKALTVEKKEYEKGNTKTYDSFDFNKSAQSLFSKGDYLFIIKEKELPKGNKPLDKARGLVISDYQKYLETEWVKKLKSKYQVVVNNETIQSIVNK